MSGTLVTRTKRALKDERQKSGDEKPRPVLALREIPGKNTRAGTQPHRVEGMVSGGLYGRHQTRALKCREKISEGRKIGDTQRTQKKGTRTFRKKLSTCWMPMCMAASAGANFPVG